ncbi:MAG: WS/DGAT domain-containing protein [Acidobacteriota bacterium]
MAALSEARQVGADAAAPRVLEPVSDHDGVWLQDSDSNRMIIHSVSTFERMPVEAFREVWDERVMQAGGGQRYPRFRKKIVNVGGKPHWLDDDGFDLARHIFPLDLELRTKEQLQNYIGRIAGDPLPDDRSPWQLQFVEEYGEESSAIVCRMHHVLGDGVALMPVIFSLMDRESTTEQVATRGTRGSMWKVIGKAALAGLPLLVSQAVRPADRSIFHGEPLSGTKRVAWTPAIPLDRIKDLKNRQGVTVNDVLLTLVSGAFARLARRRGETVDEVRVSMPVNVRSASAQPKMENRFAAAFVDLPVPITDPRERLREVHRRTTALKESAQPMIYFGAATMMLKTLPRGVSRRIIDFYARKATAVLSNVPGPVETLRIAGRKVSGMLFWVPQRADIGLGISILSFSGDVRIGIFSDVAILDDPDHFVDDLVRELDHLDASL